MPGLVPVLLLGWLAGALGDLLAETLPPRPADAPAPGHVTHYVMLPWYPLRRGVCPGCGRRIPIRALLLELACIAAIVASWLRFSADPVALAVFSLAA